MRTDLRVPFDEKYTAQQMGARWDPARKLWFVPDGVDAVPFAKWIPGLKLSKAVKRVLRRPT